MIRPEWNKLEKEGNNNNIVFVFFFLILLQGFAECFLVYQAYLCANMTRTCIHENGCAMEYFICCMFAAVDEITKNEDYTKETK